MTWGERAEALSQTLMCLLHTYRFPDKGSPCRFWQALMEDAGHGTQTTCQDCPMSSIA